MKRITTWLLNISFILVLTGMIGHEVFPHHHHNDLGEVHVCCESHQNDDPESETEATCTILSSLRLENNKPEILIYTQELKYGHQDIHFAIVGSYHLHNEIKLHRKEPIYIPQAVLYKACLTTSLSHRGPPLA